MGAPSALNSAVKEKSGAGSTSVNSVSVFVYERGSSVAVQKLEAGQGS